MSQTRVRILDRLLALVGLIATAPMCLVAALGIKVADPGPVTYRADRVGLAGVTFTMYKFRTMRVAPSGHSVRITGGDDPRVFPWGRWLRRLKVDELPQLINVVRGDMAIVGPRPEDPSIVAHGYAPWMMETLSVRPGLTSPGSLGYYADESGLPDDPREAEAAYVRDLLPRKLAADLVYVRERNLRYDGELVVRTVAGILGRHDFLAGSRRRELAAVDELLKELTNP